MKKIISILVLAIFAVNVSCNDKCDEGDKATPASFFIEIIDETTGENVFENETYTLQQITIQDLEEADIPYEFIESVNLIQIFPTVENPTGNAFVIKLNNDVTMQTNDISTTYDVSTINGECFSTYKIENILFPNNQSELVETVFVVKI